MRKLNKSELMKIFTKVPNDFIDDFYGAMAYSRSKSKNDEFQVDLLLICKWLQTTKSSIHRTLVNSYTNGVDYIETPNIAKTIGRGGSNRIQVMITIDCFKRLCMQSKTKQAELVRTYFIETDEFISNYSNIFF